MLKWLLVDYLGLRIVFIPLAFTIWITAIGVKSKRDSDFFKNSGFTKQNLKTPLIVCTLMIFAFGAIFMAFAKINHYGINTAHLLIAMLLYPIWGLLQQFIVMVFVARNLENLKRTKLEIIGITALAFGLVHIPNWPLFIATTLLGLAFTILYLRHRNLWPLGITHGILGAFFYFSVLNQDPIAQLINSLK